MLTAGEFRSILNSKRVLVIDGALATELEIRGHDLNHALWSAKLLKEDPTSIEQVHLDYFMAGADIAITASYQASTQGLAQHLDIKEQDAKDLIKVSVKLALNARDTAYKHDNRPGRHLLVAGSVGPYGAYLADGSEYRGDYSRSMQEFEAFHRPRIQALVEGGVDLLALETMPNLTEIEALLHLMRDEFPNVVAWLSCTCRDAGHLSDGSSWQSVLDVVDKHTDQIVAFGLNCIPFHVATNTLQHISRLTEMPLVCYPNSGETWDARDKKWRPDDQLYPKYAPSDQSSIDSQNTQATYPDKSILDWVDVGARLVGGCCRTGPTFIDTVATILNKPHDQK